MSVRPNERWYNLAAAVGRFVHVSVDRETRCPVPLPEALRLALRELAA